MLMLILMLMIMSMLMSIVMLLCHSNNNTFVPSKIDGFASAFSADSYSPRTNPKPKRDHSLFETVSCSPPRFDDFCESLVGSWIITENKNKNEALGSSNKNNNNGNGNGNGNGNTNNNDNDHNDNDNNDNDHNDNDNNDNDNDNDRTVVADVEEVMRSCGGAVQGIREPATTASGNRNGEEDESDKTLRRSSSSSSTYLNRANDGFVFFNDGCYTMGPTSVTVTTYSDDDNNNNNDDDAFLSCLVLPNADKEGQTRRIAVSFASGCCSSSNNGTTSKGAGPQSIPHAFTMRTKRRYGDVDNTAILKATPTVSTATIDEITTVIRCRMPSEDQPWMLQRAKWETLLPSTRVGGIGIGAHIEAEPAAADAVKDDQDNHHEATIDTTIAEDADVEVDVDDDVCGSPSENRKASEFYWVVSEPAHEFYERLGILPMMMTTTTADDASSREGIMVQCGVLCPKSKTLRLLARQYCLQNCHESCSEFDTTDTAVTTASLCGILRVEGTVRFD